MLNTARVFKTKDTIRYDILFALKN